MLDGCLARRLADWLERFTGEFHLASKYGKNASCSSGGINGVPQRYVCFVRPCDCARVDTLRSYARLDVEVNWTRGKGGEVTPKRTRQCRRVAAEAVVSKSSRLSLTPGRSLIKFKYFRAILTARRDGRWMSDFETVGGYLIKSLGVRDILLLLIGPYLAVMRISHYELKFTVYR